MLISLIFQNDPFVSHEAILGEQKSIMSELHGAFPEMALLRLCQITNESNETESCQRIALAMELSILFQKRL